MSKDKTEKSAAKPKAETPKDYLIIKEGGPGPRGFVIALTSDAAKSAGDKIQPATPSQSRNARRA